MVIVEAINVQLERCSGVWTLIMALRESKFFAGVGAEEAGMQALKGVYSDGVIVVVNDKDIKVGELPEKKLK